MKIFTGFLLATCIVVFGIFSATRSTNGQKEQDDEVTVVKRGQVTEKERAYSKEYKKLYPDYEGGKLSERRKEIRNLGVSLDGDIDIAQDPNAPVITAAEFLQSLSCKADVIVVGHVKSKAAHLTEDETLVYTEYEFSVQDILKNNSTSPIEVNNIIQITRPGGVIKLDNRRIQVVDPTYIPLQKNKEYLLFLRFVPSANGYVVASPKGDFVLEGKSFRKLSRLPTPELGENNDESQSLLNDVRSSVSAGCPQDLSGGNN
jgi:hypothetical protein